MYRWTTLKYFVTLLSFLFTFFTSSLSQQQELVCHVEKEYKDGSYRVTINGDTYLALPKARFDTLLNNTESLRIARKKIPILESDLALCEQNKNQCETALIRKNAYIAELDTVLVMYRKLINDYKKLKEPWFTLEGAIGATGDDKRPALIGGIRIRRVRFGGFLQERNTGIYVGTTFLQF